MYAGLERKCYKCNVLKPESAFFLDSTQARGREYQCKDCKRAYNREYRRKNPERMKLKDFKSDLKKRYGISYEEYMRMYEAQEGNCACCGIHESKFKRQLNVDHNHTTGEIRGLLCNRCNPGIGYFEESVERLEMAIAYLTKFKK